MDTWAATEVARRGRVGTGNTVEIPTTLWNHLHDDYLNAVAAEATGRAAVRALNELYVAHVNGYGRGYRQHAEQDACQSAFAVLATETAKQWISDSDSTRAGADAEEAE